MPDVLTFGSPIPGIPYTDRRAAYVVIVTEAGKVAAVKGREKYFLPGGGSLPGESPEETVIREVREELACDIVLIGKIGEATQYFYAASDNLHYRMQAHFFAAKFVGEPSGSGEHALYWLPITEAEHAFFHPCHAWAAHHSEAGTITEEIQSISV